jgi:glycerol uptake facilitator-like aquaporin
LVAEFIGTFALIFIGAGAAIALGVNHDPPVAFAHGLTILVFVAAFGDISGGHFNPSVTTGLAVAGVFPSRRAAPYLVAQLAGARSCRIMRSPLPALLVSLISIIGICWSVVIARGEKGRAGE